MNLNEAAEIARKQSWNFIGAAWAHDEANRVLTQTMLSWLDPTPITEEWLLENGWEQGKATWSKLDISLWRSLGHWVLHMDYKRADIKTLGELRTLLRLMGGGD